MFKRGTKIEITCGDGSTLPGRVVRLYTKREIEYHRHSHGERAAEQLGDWRVCEITDRFGTSQHALHVSALRVAA